MTATAITIQEVAGPFDATTAGSEDFTFDASAGSSGNSFVASGRELLLAYNSGSVAATMTVESEDDALGRAEDITAYSLAAGDYAVFGVGLTNTKGWKDSSGLIQLTTTTANIKVAVLRLPAGFGR